MKKQFKADVAVNNVPVTVHNYKGRNFIAGEKGDEFAVRVYNSSSERVLAVISIDGLCVITGRETLVNNGGYVISALGNIDVRSWLINREPIVSFMFSDIPGAYIDKIALPRPEDIGIIKIEIFKEKRIGEKLDMQLGLRPQSHESSVPVSHGNIRSIISIEGGVAVTAPFLREDFPAASVSYGYNSLEALKDQGVIST
ncbi:MAG: hypothetical protein ACD_3C00180G0003 [uncultured bacterium (gcode 4)]|uniref:Uncharacterized protein n=1 Tax=uncultured bacterium (gcode 4) TaxID=1234023 RepID=K2G0K1_9BACT|nr:MAG: hypothetical protein ACD_3C00180G0003 [uncultured bacterium (gcode 4)]